MEEQPADTMPAPAGISLADVAGTWDMTSVSEDGGDTVQFQLMASDDPSGWMLHLPDRPPVSVRILEVAGDSIVAEAGPFESVLRPGVQVTTHTVYRLEGDRLVGTIVARFQTTGPDSVLNRRAEGTRTP